MSLFVISMPIGNPDDITLRAIETLKKVDFLICEEYKIGRKLLKRLDINKELYHLNEHNEKDEGEHILQLLLQGKDAAVFSDCGTPLFADPGTYLVNRCHQSGIRVIPVPGASSLMAALSVSGIDIKQFYYAGFLPRKTEERQKEIRKLKTYHCPVIIFDTPYRLKALLYSLKEEIPPDQRIILFLSLTQPDEKIIHGSVSQVFKQLNQNPPKKEFVLILQPKDYKKSKKRVKKHKRVT